MTTLQHNAPSHTTYLSWYIHLHLCISHQKVGVITYVQHYRHESMFVVVSCGSLVEVALGDGNEVGVYGGHDSDEGGLTSES